MRILHVTNSPRRGATDGIVKAVVDLAFGQKTRGHDVMIAIDRRVPFTETCSEHGISIIEYGELAPGSEGILLTETAVQGFIPRLESLSPDIIHCHSGFAALVGIAAGNQVGIPCVLTGDSAKNIVAGRNRGLRFAALCLNHISLNKLNDVPDVFYVPNGASAGPPTHARQLQGGHTPSILVVGSLVPRKAVEIAILAMFDLRRRLGPDCPALNIYGDGERREYLTEMSAVLGLDDIVTFHGFELGILGTCPSTDVLLMPSRSEATPLPVLEAMSRGMPIIATDVGDVTNMIPDQRYGRVIPAGSIEAIAEAVESLLADIAGGRFNSELLIERYRSYYSIEKWAERVEAVYRQVLLKHSMRA
jgi:glycosyltransferase involved in cell wall biosynthesis